MNLNRMNRGFESMIRPRTKPEEELKPIIDHKLTFRLFSSEYTFVISLKRSIY